MSRLLYSPFGIEAVSLLNGYALEEGEAASVVCEWQLNSLIALELSLSTKVLSGAELRFMCEVLHLSDDQFARICGEAKDTVCQWWASTAIPQTISILTKQMFLDKQSFSTSIWNTIDRAGDKANQTETTQNMQFQYEAESATWYRVAF